MNLCGGVNFTKGIQSKNRKGIHKPIIQVIIVGLIITFPLSIWFYNENLGQNCGTMYIISVKRPIIEKEISNSQNQSIRTLEIQFRFTPQHIEKNWLGKERIVQRPYEGTIVLFTIGLYHMGSQAQYVTWLDNKSYRTDEYLSNDSLIKTSYSKEKNNLENGWKSSDGIITVKLNLEKANNPINYSAFYTAMTYADVRESPPGHISLGHGHGEGLWEVVGLYSFGIQFQTFNRTQ